MILVDIGNTHIQFAIAANNSIVQIKRLDTITATIIAVKSIIRAYSNQPIIISSVVPGADELFLKLPQPVYIALKNLPIPIQCDYDRKAIGADRLVCAYAAKKLYPKSRIIIDLGTATTIDFVSSAGKYEGGFILPGIGSTMKVLSNCALLPKKIKIEFNSKIKNIIPRNTRESINRGISEGFILMLDGFIGHYQKILKLKINQQSPVIITGGDSPAIASLLGFSAICDPLLIFNGLSMLGKNLPVKP